MELYRGYTGIIDKKMETTIMDYIGYILGLYWGLYWDNGKENGNHYSIIGCILGLYRDYIGVIYGLCWCLATCQSK